MNYNLVLYKNVVRITFYKKIMCASLTTIILYLTCRFPEM